VIVAIGYYALRYLYSPATPAKLKRINKGIYNVAEFQRQFGAPPEFHPDNLKPMTKDEDPEGLCIFLHYFFYDIIM